jgi:hypothetical protein
MYYLINVIKDLQLQISNINNSCSITPSPSNSNPPNNEIKTETIDIKMKKDFIYILDYVKNYFI